MHIKINSDSDFNRFWLRIKAEPDEKVYGCGAQASYFNLRGHNVPLWTSESGVGRDVTSKAKYFADLYDKGGGNNFTTYYPEPTFVSTRKYWLHIDTFSYSEFNFTNADYHEFYLWEIPEEIIISYQDDYFRIIDDLTDYTGKTQELPEYVLDGMILGVQGGIDQVKDYLARAIKHNIKVSGVWCQDWAGIKITTFGKRLHWNWQVNAKLYPDLKKEIEELNQKDIQFLTYICPFLLEEESLFNEAKAKDFLVYDLNKDIYKVDFGEFFCGIVDLTKPDAFAWYKEIIKKNIIGMGITGWMADFGEYLPTDCVLYNQKDAKSIHNQWPVLWAKCNFEAIQETGLIGKVFYFMRSGGFQSQKYATALWAGDQLVNWEKHDGIASVIPISLSTGIIGNPFIHSDIGGYTSLYGNYRTKELFERWLEMNVFSSIMRTHEGNRPSVNFQFYNDEETMDLMSRMTNVRYDLKPYIKALIKEAVEHGYPLQRPLFIHYEHDPRTYDIQDQYLFGKDILVSPVLEEGRTSKEVYLPDDVWVHLWTGKEFKGSQNATVDCKIGFPPVFYRKDSKFRSLFETFKIKYET